MNTKVRISLPELEDVERLAPRVPQKFRDVVDGLTRELEEAKQAVARAMQHTVHVRAQVGSGLAPTSDLDRAVRDQRTATERVSHLEGRLRAETDVLERQERHAKDQAVADAHAMHADIQRQINPLTPVLQQAKDLEDALDQLMVRLVGKPIQDALDWPATLADDNRPFRSPGTLPSQVMPELFKR